MAQYPACSSSTTPRGMGDSGVSPVSRRRRKGIGSSMGRRYSPYAPASKRIR